MILKLWRTNLPENWSKEETKQLLEEMELHDVTQIVFYEDIIKKNVMKFFLAAIMPTSINATLNRDFKKIISKLK